MHAGIPLKSIGRGFIVLIGGAEDRARNPVVLRRFVALCGGKHSHIAVIPSASSLGDTGDIYRSVFRDLGADRVSILLFKRREDCESEEYLNVLDRADGVFMTGGDQVRLAELLNGTSAARKLCERNARGMHIAGTSAGASAMSAAMIAGGESGVTPRAGMVDLAPGLGLVGRFVIDQHFSERDRLGRLLTAVTSVPCGAGIGLDEDTAAFIGPDGKLEVVGRGSVTIVEGANRHNQPADSDCRDGPPDLGEIRLHILAPGSRYDLASPTHPGGPLSAKLYRGLRSGATALSWRLRHSLKPAKLANLQTGIRRIRRRYSRDVSTASALGLRACKQGLSALRRRATRLVDDLHVADRTRLIRRRFARFAARTRDYFS